MKKNELTDKNYGKCSKGFYAALGISAVMIGAACLFAHDQGDKLTDIRHSTITDNTAVDKHVTNIPKATTPAYRITTAVTAALFRTERTQATLPAAEITVDAPPVEADDTAAEDVQEPVPVAADANMQEAAAPLADISNIIQPFSGGELVKNETTGSWQTHNGTDFSAEIGADVYAVANGEVSAVKNDPLWGVTLTIDHKNGYTTKYCGLGSDLAVQQGDTVESGSTIGAVGGTADIESAIASHLHIEMTHNGEYIDPMTVLKS
ncbi:MAG: M23 family metallopeptidase [Ruminococcus sp.]|uniref:M23 family metallopeptidase n=1 Tax=Ruminococcus sp. TaxID=41978 RepID=UPI0025DCD76D|nr:M23 family metallopeptidase [Ruminococcus sp.]MCR5601464.1 M23 family metallopeptidase [Ruminococcus sp.]